MFKRSWSIAAFGSLLSGRYFTQGNELVWLRSLLAESTTQFSKFVTELIKVNVAARLCPDLVKCHVVRLSMGSDGASLADLVLVATHRNISSVDE